MELDLENYKVSMNILKVFTVKMQTFSGTQCCIFQSENGAAHQIRWLQYAFCIYAAQNYIFCSNNNKITKKLSFFVLKIIKITFFSGVDQLLRGPANLGNIPKTVGPYRIVWDRTGPYRTIYRGSFSSHTVPKS